MRFVIMSCIACLMLASCTARDKLYRHHQDDYCNQNLIYLPDQGTGRVHERKLDPDALTSENAPDGATPANCYFQQHAGAAEPATLAHEIGAKENPAHRFNLAFIELGEDGNYLSKSQYEKLLASLDENRRAGKRNHVIMFVHGWRHDAALDNANVRTFRTLLNYSSSFVKERDENAVVTGVYVGWRGRSFGEPTRRGKLGNALGFVGSVWTFWARKRASERIAAGLHDLLGRIDDDLKSYSAKRPAHPDTFMVAGHSFGGNMIATAVKKPIRKALKHHTPGEEFVLPYADLIVLINPAAEASKMNDLQRRIRQRVGIHEDKPSRDFSDDERRRFETLFPITQPPRYISLTSTRNWSEIELRGRDKPSYDSATGFWFPLGQLVIGRSGEERVAIGHHHANYKIRELDDWELRRRDPKEHRRPRIEGSQVGASHDMITIKGANIPTEFDNAENPEVSACPKPQNRWLFEARDIRIPAGDEFGRSWDTAYTHTGARVPLLRWERPGNFGNSAIEVQFRHQLGIKLGREDVRRAQPISIAKTFHSVAPANSPIWITRAFDNVISKHGGFQNYAMWCALSQMVLDDVAGRPD